MVIGKFDLGHVSVACLLVRLLTIRDAGRQYLGRAGAKRPGERGCNLDNSQGVSGLRLLNVRCQPVSHEQM